MRAHPLSALAQHQPSCGEGSESEPPLVLLQRACARPAGWGLKALLAMLGRQHFILYYVLKKGLGEGWI